MDTKHDNVEELQNELVDATTKTIKPKKDKKESDTTKKKPTAKKADRSTTKKKNASKSTSDTASKKKTATKKQAEGESDTKTTVKSTAKTSKEKTVKNTKTTTRKSKASETSNDDSKKAVKEPSKKVAKDTTKKAPATKKAKDKKEADEKTKTIVKDQESTVQEGKETVENKIEELKETNVTPASPIKENIKQFKLFFVSDMDEEATYLHEMSLKGLHFESKKGMQYFFKQGEATNYFYHLGYHEKDKHDGTRYLDNYADAGWDNIYHEKAEFDGVWNYFRIEMPEGVSEPNIFSDRSSRLSLYKRLLSAWRSLLALDVICFLCMLFVYVFLTNHPGKLTGTVMSICVILILLIIVIFVIYLRAYLKISKKQNELQNI